MWVLLCVHYMHLLEERTEREDNDHFKTQWSLYVPHSGYYMYRTAVTICTASLTFNNSTFYPLSVFMCFMWISEQTAIISLYGIN
jgi:hypothetical protein